MTLLICSVIGLIVGGNLGYLLGAYITYRMFAEHIEEGDVEDVKRN